MQRTKTLLHMRGLLVAAICCCLFTSFYPCEAIESLKAVPDSIVLLKQKHELQLYRRHALLKTYKVALGLQPVGAKQWEGDMRTPEGMYRIQVRNEHSLYHKSLGISYPSLRDVANAKRLGKRPGGNIMIHGLPNGQGYVGNLHRLKDWTHGCIALTDEEIDEIFKYVSVGTQVNILP